MTDIETRKRMTVSAVEDFFDRLLRGRVGDALFFGELPSSFNSTFRSLVIVDAANAIRDYEAYGAATVLIYLVAKPNTDGTKDVAVISGMEMKLTELLDSNDDPHYTTTRRGSYGKYDTVNDVFFNVVQVNLIIS